MLFFYLTEWRWQSCGNRFCPMRRPLPGSGSSTRTVSSPKQGQWMDVLLSTTRILTTIASGYQSSRCCYLHPWTTVKLGDRTKFLVLDKTRVADPTPDPSIIKHKSKANLDFYCFVTFLVAILKALTKIAGSESGSVSQRYGSADPDPGVPKLPWILNTADNINFLRFQSSDTAPVFLRLFAPQ